ncbi:flagellar type III secretion system pore protein FliP [Ramlibacter pinisoli]|uniref:Flagellar biosynthetic protein FliP n=1 Tax=Ramlibacter pinisoli TaxID=2682844 RepID=A0A6N8ISD0_9BURK|nr:flagellar type III secretion system pore protein FliP [Ramlibacter pinisoli]MBA2964773.1 flagellar type III secretion system pore protein FliP [Ramlibacter sp. CGMCC 1.13660]MVQ29738.1 flagellar type III secretion system pore protein FliP [Ramlibacter pinisoli]
MRRWCRVLGWLAVAAWLSFGGWAAAAPQEAVPGAGPGAQRAAVRLQTSTPARKGLVADLPSPGQQQGTSQALRIVLGLTALAVLPALLVCLTSFLRIVIVLSMLRHALGMPETPPNPVVIGLALFLTLFTMAPVLHQVNHQAFQPFMDGTLAMDAAYERGAGPLREFMVRQTREEDLALTVELSHARPPASLAEVSNVQLIPAFMLSELRAAFQIGFVVWLPFLLIDLVVSASLMSLGMMMLPPSTVALPLKILVFVLVDGWALLLKALVGSFH